MKKRIISVLLALVMVLTSAVTVSVTAEVPSENLSATITAALAGSDNATVTLDADATAIEAISVPAGKTLTIEGSGKTYTSVYGFIANGGTLTVKNLNVVLSSGSTAAFGEAANGGTLSFENCTFTAEAAITRANGHFSIVDGADATMNLTNCNISIAKNTDSSIRAMFYSGITNAVFNLSNVDFDTSANDA